MTDTTTLLPQSSSPSALDDYLFDLNGFLIVKGVLSASELDDLNGAFDSFPPIAPGEWTGNSQRRDYTADTGYELHNCLEYSAAFDPLIDHPGWIAHARRYAGEADSYTEGVFIDECIATIRTAGGHHPVHSGGHRSRVVCERGPGGEPGPDRLIGKWWSDHAGSASDRIGGTGRLPVSTRHRAAASASGPAH